MHWNDWYVIFLSHSSSRGHPFPFNQFYADPFGQPPRWKYYAKTALLHCLFCKPKCRSGLRFTAPFFAPLYWCNICVHLWKYAQDIAICKKVNIRSFMSYCIVQNDCIGDACWMICYNQSRARRGNIIQSRN